MPSVGLALAIEPAQLLFVASDTFGERLHGGSQVTDLGHHPREASGVVGALTMLFDHHPEVLVSIKGRPADAGPLGDVGEAHRCGVPGQLGTRPLDPSKGVGRRHPASASLKSASRRAMRR